MVDTNPQNLQPLMELNITPPDGYPKLPKWDSTLQYKLKDSSLVNAFENPFHINSDLSESENSENTDFARLRRIAELLPKSALPPPHRVEEPAKKSIPQSKTPSKSKKFRRRPAPNQEVPIRYKTMSESEDSSERSNVSTSSGNSLSYVEKYLELKRRKALFLKKVRENHGYINLEPSIKLEDPDLLNETDFFLEENVIKRENDFDSAFPHENSNSIKETSFINNSRSSAKVTNLSNNNDYGKDHHNHSSTVEKNFVFRNDLNTLTDQMNEWYI